MRTILDRCMLECAAASFIATVVMAVVMILLIQAPSITFQDRWAPVLNMPRMLDSPGMYHSKDRDKLPPPIRTRIA